MFYHKEDQAFRNSLAGYFSAGARLPRWRYHEGSQRTFSTAPAFYISL